VGEEQDSGVRSQNEEHLLSADCVLLTADCLLHLMWEAGNEKQGLGTGGRGPARRR
jgi:hypothetical protein